MLGSDDLSATACVDDDDGPFVRAASSAPFAYLIQSARTSSLSPRLFPYHKHSILHPPTEKRKKEIQSLTPYQGDGESSLSSSVGGSSLMEYNSNFSSGSLFNSDGIGFTDLRQAYAESVIPVTEEDFNKVQKFKNINDYKRHRDNINVAPLNKEDAMYQLLNQDRQRNEESAALAFYYAQQSEKAKQNNTEFWSGLKQITDR